MTAPAGGPFCRQCGEPATGGQFCARCGTPLPITPPAAGPKSGMRGVLAIVCVSLIVLGVATFFGVRWWIAPSAQDGNAIAGDVESSLAGNGSDESGGAVPSDHRSSKAPGTPTSSSVVESDGASTVVVTSVSVAPPVQTTVTVQSTVTATPSADAAVGAPRLDVTCDHSYIVVLASSLSASDFSAMLPGSRRITATPSTCTPADRASTSARRTLTPSTTARTRRWRTRARSASPGPTTATSRSPTPPSPTGRSAVCAR